MRCAQVAKAGVKRYFTGKPCPSGHLSARYTSTRGCVECLRVGASVWRKKNPEKRRATKAAWSALNPEKVASHKRTAKYGQDGATLFEEQGGACAICKVDLRSLPSKQRHLDHHHNTKEVRGWLCAPCNLAIGLMKDGEGRLLAAAAYVSTR